MKHLLSLLLGLTACASPNQNGSGSNFTPLYVYGDSISAGGGVGDGYPDIIAAQMGWYEINKSIGGTEMDSPNQYNLFLWDCCTTQRMENGAKVMFSPGVNDSNNVNTPGYITIYTNDLTTLLQNISTRSVTVYIGTPIHHCNEAKWGVNATSVDVFAAINRQVVASVAAPNVILVEYNQNFVPTVDNTIDCLHPNISGYTQMAQIFDQQIQ
jgi:lysophospholipase L1-like esterase